MSLPSELQKKTREFEVRQCKKVLRTPLFVREEDRLTNLPSCLKTKILSCLPTEDAVRTSVLSRNWKQSWTSVTNLDFYYSPWPPRKSEAKSFKRFVSRVLLLHDKSCLQGFYLESEGTYDGSLVNSWIASVLLCKIQEFDLRVRIKSPAFLPSDLFLCKTLVVLKLDARGKVNIPTSICLPVLKTLHLVDVELLDDVAIVNLVSGCPVLEELSLNQFLGKNVGVINITAPALTSLSIISAPYEYEESGSVYNYQVVIDAPALEYLIISDYEAQGYVVKNLNHLFEADIDNRDPNAEIPSIENRKAMTDLFNGISRVQSLVLSKYFIEAIFFEKFVLPTFSYLKWLKLGSVYVELTYLAQLLKSFPCLETLHIKKYEYDRTLHRRICKVSPSCLREHLKIIKIDEFRGFVDEMKMVEYFLKTAKVLEKLSISYDMWPKGQLPDAKFFQQLLMLPRSSASCKVEVSWAPTD